MAFAEQVATLADFLDQLLEGNRLPLALAALANALERLQDAIGLVSCSNIAAPRPQAVARPSMPASPPSALYTSRTGVRMSAGWVVANGW